MSVGIQIGNLISEVGTPDFLHAFFSTVSGNLEKGAWGERFPVILLDLYNGEVPQEKSVAAIEELKTIQRELAELSPDKVIWDIEHREKTPPWGDAIADDITDLSNYFVTSTGHDLLSMLIEIFEAMPDFEGPAFIVEI